MIRSVKNKIYTILCIIMTLFLTACAEVREVPQLIEPLADNQSFRPVSRMTIGTLRVEVGHVVGREYSHFYNRPTTIKEIKCDYGEYVEKGQILAVADVETMKEQLEDLEAEYALLISKQELIDDKHDINLKILQSNRQACLYQYDDIGASEIDVSIRKENEDKLYDDTLYEFMLNYYQREMADLQKDISEATIQAKKSGYVTYIKDTSQGNTVVKNEAVIIVSDYDDVHIEVEGLKVGKETYKKYEVKYALINGEQVPIEEYEYTTQESVVAKSQETYPNLRYRTTVPTKLKVGDTVLLGFIAHEKEDVMAVGRDSINTDETGSYVYVKSDDGSMEKKYVELGVSDDFYIEIMSGLAEGEEVYYVQESSKPVTYEEYKVERKHFTQTSEGKNLKKAATINTAYFSESDGKVEKILVGQGDKFKKGDTLVVIDTGGGSANIQEAQNEISHLELDFKKMIKDSDKQISELKLNNLLMLTDIEEGRDSKTLTEKDIDIIECQRTVLLHQASLVELDKQLSILDYGERIRKAKRREEKIRKNNNGQGEIMVTALDDGVVSRIYVTEGKKTEVGGENYLLLSCTQDSKDVASAAIGRDTQMPGIGNRIIVSVNQSDEKYMGTVIGSFPEGKATAYTEDDKAYVSFCRYANMGTPVFHVKMDDPEFFDKVNLNECQVSIVELDIPGAIVLPGKLVYSEESKMKGDKQSYVWKIQDNQLVKQYITIGTDYRIGNNLEVVVLMGLSEGDILAMEGNRPSD